MMRGGPNHRRGGDPNKPLQDNTVRDTKYIFKKANKTYNHNADAQYREIFKFDTLPEYTAKKRTGCNRQCIYHNTHFIHLGIIISHLAIIVVILKFYQINA